MVPAMLLSTWLSLSEVSRGLGRGGGRKRKLSKKGRKCKKEQKGERERGCEKEEERMMMIRSK